MADQLLTLQQVADRFQLSVHAVRRAIRRGELEAALVCGKYRVDPAELDAWWDRSKVHRPSVVDTPAPRPAPRLTTTPPRHAARGSLRALDSNADGRAA